MENIAVIGGLGTLSGGDVFFKLLKNRNVLKNQLNYQFIFEQKPYQQMNLPLYQEEDIKSRKFYTYKICKNFENQQVSKILLPCFASHSFLDELQKEIPISIVNIFEALKYYVDTAFEKGTKIGILTSSFVLESRMFEKWFQDYELVYPTQQNALMEAIYGEYGIKNGYLDGLALETVYESCLDLKEKGCEIILPGITEISLIVDSIRKRGISIIDVNQIYADFALEYDKININKPFKIGILGGVGPSATVDFMNKIIQNTPAKKDQDHIKMIVEQNPQIPDRTAHLIHNETDPTIAMFSTCKRLEAEGADAIAIPCNTAHAFVESIQEHLKIPVINMLTTTGEFILNHFSKDTKVGLLATSGTLASKVYHHVFEKFGFETIIPDEEHQAFVMESIYGEFGVKAGFEDGKSKDDILKAVKYLISKEADVIVLGCTELPLLFKDQNEIVGENKVIHLIDPTLVLAKKMVSLATINA